MALKKVCTTLASLASSRSTKECTRRPSALRNTQLMHSTRCRYSGMKSLWPCSARCAFQWAKSSASLASGARPSGTPFRRRQPAMSGMVSMSNTRTGQTMANLLAGGEEFGRIDRFALAAHLEVQLHAVGVAVAHLGDLFAAAHLLVFLDQQLLVVGVSRQVGVVVLEDDQVAIAAQACAGIHHLAVGRGQHRVAGLACDVHALVLGFVKALDHLAIGRPGKVDVFGRHRVVGWWQMAQSRCRA